MNWSVGLINSHVGYISSVRHRKSFIWGSIPCEWLSRSYIGLIMSYIGLNSYVDFHISNLWPNTANVVLIISHVGPISYVALGISFVGLTKPYVKFKKDLVAGTYGSFLLFFHSFREYVTYKLAVYSSKIWKSVLTCTCTMDGNWQRLKCQLCQRCLLPGSNNQIHYVYIYLVCKVTKL